MQSLDQEVGKVTNFGTLKKAFKKMPKVMAQV